VHRLPAAVKAPPSQLALAVVVCLLTLVALARSETYRSPEPPQRPLRAAAPGPQPQAVRALRQGETIELNRASPGDLLLLPGVGPKLAQRIAEERTRRHGFATLEELRAVKGIGPAKLAQLRPLLRVEALEIEQPRGGQAHGEIERLERSVAEHEDGPGAQAEHQLAPH